MCLFDWLKRPRFHGAAKWAGHTALVIVPLWLLSVLPIQGDTVPAQSKHTIGSTATIKEVSTGLAFPARIDTGAATSSLDARDLIVKDDIAEFSLPEGYGNLRIHLPVMKWQTIRSARSRSRRPMVEIEFCLGPKHLKTRVNLNDRSQVKYPLLVGRNALKKNFVVDCMKERCAPPTCPQVPAK